MKRIAQVMLRETGTFEPVAVADRDKPDIPAEMEQKWQRIINIMARILDVPAGLVMRITDHEMQVFLKSQNESNPYPPSSCNHTFYGRRIKRGLYRSADGTVINADINGACNILQKSKQNFDFEELCRGLLVSPLRIRVA